MTTCPDDFDTDRLFKAVARSAAETIRVQRRDVNIVLSCCVSSSEDRVFEYKLQIRDVSNDGVTVSVSRQAWFDLLCKHDKHHRVIDHQFIQHDDPRCSCATCAKIRKARGAKEPTPREDVPAIAPTRDPLKEALNLYFDAGSKLGQFKTLCDDNNIDPDKFNGRSFGLARMALGNELRGLLKSGKTVKVGKLRIDKQTA
jgi:hypothetical protein